MRVNEEFFQGLYCSTINQMQSGRLVLPDEGHSGFAIDADRVDCHAKDLSHRHKLSQGSEWSPTC